MYEICCVRDMASLGCCTILQEWNWIVKPSILQEIDGEMASCISVHEDLLVVSAEILVESAVN